MTFSTYALSALMLLTVLATSPGAIPAFPGAEGWGGESIGGRGGKIIHVTNLRASGAGSLSAAVAVSGPKIIVFDTAGVINLMSNPLRITSNTTIAGQSSPGGITLATGGIYTASGASNIIVRHIRVRRSPNAPDGDCFRFESATDCIFDHCSGLWCSDEILDLVRAARITVQYTSISEPGQCYEYYGSGDGYGNSKTGILGNTVVGGITLYRCLLSDHGKRTPYLSNSGASNAGQTFEFINNFIYNCNQASGESFDGNTIPLNLVGNCYKPGRNAIYFPPYFAHKGSAGKIMYVHASGNYHTSQPTKTSPANFFDSTTVTAFVDTFIAPRKTQAVLSGQEAMAEVMARVGAFPRDAAELRVINETRAATAAWMTGCAALADPLLGYAGYKTVDSDRDGMADSWENAHGLNPSDSTDHTTIMNGGYDAVEVYLNELSDSLIARGDIAVERPVLFQKLPALRISPNPFNGRVTISLQPGSAGQSNISVWNVTGRRVFHQILKTVDQAESSLLWDAHNSDGSLLPAGSYLVTLVQGNERFTRKIALIR